MSHTDLPNPQPDETHSVSDSQTSLRPSLAVGLLAALSLALVTFVVIGQDGSTDPVAALNEGNRLFRSGQLQEAAQAYEGGYAAEAPHPTLIYNLGTTLHHLDRLPEAILWYRRGGASQDPWLQENLWLARRSLGSQTLPPGGLFGHLTENAWLLRTAGVVLAWLTLAVFLVVPRLPWWSLASLACLTVLLYGGAWGLERWGPAPAVLLQDCSTPAGDLPAGTEVWVQQAGDAWRLSGSRVSFCPLGHAELVHPRP